MATQHPLQVARDKREHSIADLARWFGVSWNTAFAWLECSAEPNAENLRLWATYCDRSTDDLLDDLAKVKAMKLAERRGATHG